MIKIDSIMEFEEVIDKNKSLFLFKHSLTCPISQAAFEEYEKFASSKNDFPKYYLAVQDSRPLSNHIAEKYTIKHESPQAFFIVNNNVVWHTSHWRITNESLAKALEENK